MRLKGNNALITGAAQGIGKEIALCLAREGADIAICDVNEEALSQTKAEIESRGRQSLAVVIDVSSSKETEDMVNKTLDKFKRIDILVNNAGITRDSLLIRMKEDDWDAVLSTN